MITARLSKQFIRHVISDNVLGIRFHGFRKNIKFLSINSQH